MARVQLVILAPFMLVSAGFNVRAWWAECRSIWNNGWPFID